MNWVDLVIILVLLLYAYRGWVSGFLSIGTGLVGFIVSLALATLLYIPAGSVLRAAGVSHNLSKAVAFLLLWLVAAVIFSLAAGKLSKKIPRRVRASTANRIAGIVPAVIEGLIVVAFVALLVVAMPSPAMPKDDVLDSAIAGPLVETAAAIQQKAAGIFGGAVREALAFLTIEPDPTSRERIDLGYRTRDVHVNFEAERKMLALVNGDRMKRNLPPLVIDDDLTAVARAHSRDMFARGYFSHVNPDELNPFDRMRRRGIGFEVAGENLAFAPTVPIAHEGLMNSPGHRENILASEFRRVGIGAVTNSIRGTMFSQEFTN
ncbi:MAG: CvpA family protein [Armatimonadetes bacterium]|nr:CvpA family protein [Armatimonadota bacterium]